MLEVDGELSQLISDVVGQAIDVELLMNKCEKLKRANPTFDGFPLNLIV